MTVKEQKLISDKLQDPVMMKRIVDMVLDPKNPDSNKVRKEILKNISNCIQKDDAFLTVVKDYVIQAADAVTRDVVTNCINESNEYLTNALVTTINNQCQAYFETQKNAVTKILKKTVEDCVADILKATKEAISINQKKIADDKKKSSVQSVSVDVPLSHQKEVENYIKFLSTNH